MKIKLLFVALFSLTLLVSVASPADPYPGYTLFAPKQGTNTYLIDMDGQVVNTWVSSLPTGACVYLQEDGTLIRTWYEENGTFPGTHGGIVQRLAWDGTVLWEYDYSDETHMQHHDLAVLPNGNILLLANQYKTLVECIAAGRDPSTMNRDYLFPESIIEVEPSGTHGGTIVWEWHVWDHLVQDFDPTRDNYGVVADHPELVDLNFTSNYNADWLHANSVAHNAEFDQIILSVNNMGEIWVIDHSTTTAEASGHSGGNSGTGGDLLYRWGNPQTYGAGTSGDKHFWFQHDAEWIPADCPGAGHILVYHNGLNRPGGSYSSVEELVPPVDAQGHYSLAAGTAYGPADPVWIYSDPGEFFSGYMSGQQRLPNGNTLICEAGPGYFFEVTPSGETVWDYTNPYPDPGTNAVFKVERYAPDYPGLVFIEGTVGAELTCQPSSGTLPFVTQMRAELANRYLGQARRLAGRIDVVIAGGSSYSNWKSGWTNLSAGNSHVTTWNQTLPALGSLIGDNSFTLVTVDVTPVPYNQPPYPPAADTHTVTCTVTGVAP